MAAPETAIVNSIMLETSKSGTRLWRNIRGQFYTLDSVRAIITAIKSANWKCIIKALNGLRQIRAGLLAEDSGDLIGFTPIKITPEMVGRTIAVFVSIEVKTETGRIAPGQQGFASFVVKNGGFAGIARNIKDAEKILKISIDEAK